MSTFLLYEFRPQYKYVFSNLATGYSRSTWHAGRLSMFSSKQIGGIVSEKCFQCYRTIIGNTYIYKLLMFHISIGTKQVKQQ